MTGFTAGQCKTQTADCRMETGDKMETEGKMQTVITVDHGGGGGWKWRRKQRLG